METLPPETRAHWLTHAIRAQTYPNRRPQDAASLLILDFSASEPRILMGRRHGGHAFLPGKFVFPGGRVDRGDSRVKVSSDLHPEILRRLLVEMPGRATPARARALALAAIRETHEETGLVIRETSSSSGTATSDTTYHPLTTATPHRSADQRSRSASWQRCFAHGVSPCLDRLAFLARAITPPRRPRRYDTRFFCLDARHVHEGMAETDGELLDVTWLPLSDAKKADIAPVTRIILAELEDRLLADNLFDPYQPVPFYRMVQKSFTRRLIT